ncbi:hypothetical protein [Streptomyces camelliae]|uniref:Uncharacterized protein n=1 Tax=Streptomyces camelliae TaxID=3004093 RepID=A0ABY7PF34_9ACTN|nr:hypothetical protein [Streptomyces sp. HUAS 2-6]WBO68187.1 hypothetical protein O1G22_37895 [Streptomyces sp. HUAS 2-6]
MDGAEVVDEGQVDDTAGGACRTGQALGVGQLAAAGLGPRGPQRRGGLVGAAGPSTPAQPRFFSRAAR